MAKNCYQDATFNAKFLLAFSMLHAWHERLAMYLQGIQTRLQKFFEKIDDQLLWQRKLKSLWLQ